MKALQLGWVIALGMTLGVLGGLFIDKRFHTTPFGIIAGSLLGISVSAYQVYRTLAAIEQEEAQEKQNKTERK